MTGYSDLQARFAALGSGKADRIILGQFGLLAVQRAKEKVPKKTGNLARSIRVERVDVQAQTVRVVAGGTQKAANQHARYDRSVGYAADVEFGTKPHIIRPRYRKALAWGGARRLTGSLRSGAKATHFARVVHHPGTRAQPYMRPGAQQALNEVGLANAVIQVWNSAA